jgi:hypothetical protein
MRQAWLPRAPVLIRTNPSSVESPTQGLRRTLSYQSKQLDVSIGGQCPHHDPLKLARVTPPESVRIAGCDSLQLRKRAFIATDA